MTAEGADSTREMVAAIGAKRFGLAKLEGS
jgi:hypothetical protein